MKNFYCPYCNPKYQFHKNSPTGELICGLCGDPLVKKPLIKINQIIAILASLSLVLPLIYTFIILIKNQVNPSRRNYQANTNSIEKISKLRFYQPLQSDLLKQESLSLIWFLSLILFNSLFIINCLTDSLQWFLHPPLNDSWACKKLVFVNKINKIKLKILFILNFILVNYSTKRK